MSGSYAKTRRRSDLPLRAGATDVIAEAPVKIVPGGIWAVQACATSSDRPVGIAEASANAGHAVAVRDRGEIERLTANATIAAGEYVGVIGVGATVGASGNIQVPLIGPVARASGAAVWSIGEALEAANPGQIFAFLIDPKQISGLV